MDVRYEAFCFADPLFFDEPRGAQQDDPGFGDVLAVPASGWRQRDLGVWRMLFPETAALPGQGWKIHVSSAMDNAERVLGTVYRYCVARGVAFKHLRSKPVLLSRNSKYATRQSSGKLVTIYPADERQLETILADLSAELDGEQGPYILSDLRYGAGPLYVRYGGFTEQWMESDGTRVLAVTKPDGTRVPDRRTPTFSVPDWVTVPRCLEPHLAARRSTGAAGEFGYRVTGSLHFSNGGGVYRAERLADGRHVVLKEGRPHAGLDRDGVDAVARLHREHAVLTRLAGIPGVPEVHDLFTAWEHTFLAMEDVPGVPLGSWLARNYPLTRSEVTGADLTAYTERALRLLDAITTVIHAVHERGIVFGDLHPLNVLVDTDDTVRLIDFELAAPVEEGGRPALGAPGFRAPEGCEGFAIDEHALAALRLWMFLPLNPMLELAPARLGVVAASAERRFALPEGCLAPRSAGGAVTELDEPRPDWGVVRKAIAEAVLASATPERTDRLFPGDIEQFRLGGTCLAYGAAGVLHALDVAGAGRYPEHERWLLDAVRREPPARPGLLDGAYGIAYVLAELDHRDEALALAGDAATLVEQTRDPSYGSGLAGIGLTLLHLGFDGDALRVAERVAAALGEAPEPGPSARAGLSGGWSGPALLFVRLFQHTGDRDLLALADRALALDLRECVTADDATLQVRDGDTRTLPYVAVGSAGIALVASELAAVEPGAASAGSLPELLRACRGEFVIHPGLLYGRCGLAAALAAADRAAPEPAHADAVALHLSRLAWHAVPHGERGLAFPGNQLLRLSMDLATGGAGILLTLSSILDGHGAVLPFLGGPRPSR
ncbi:class III lanthionine synthetase LanKC [Prauserella muralis]|uniref:non-specific serine/threonine protein kinase n=1 Tax=Prauserella muralis TaxID=588067 RepID=A0A2V4B7K5_9PSEU|nr:class III lanthionine synthetase LanKC [Prauserella muralis]PXY31365.1 serine/threonine protein kinase [Prauserella muralis]TWE14312.1 protein kinase-like protein [Prauserella muralis]